MKAAVTTKTGLLSVIDIQEEPQPVGKDGWIVIQVKALYPHGVDEVLKVIGTATLKDSLQCIRPKGMVCTTGILSVNWTMPGFTPTGDISSH